MELTALVNSGITRRKRWKFNVKLLLIISRPKYSSLYEVHMNLTSTYIINSAHSQWCRPNSIMDTTSLNKEFRET